MNDLPDLENLIAIGIFILAWTWPLLRRWFKRRPEQHQENDFRNNQPIDPQ
ncbi:MAG: hypothetical protein AAF604_11370 [Acidobacteriota bacterium]